jgi:hypothetical protein
MGYWSTGQQNPVADQHSACLAAACSQEGGWAVIEDDEVWLNVVEQAPPCLCQGAELGGVSVPYVMENTREVDNRANLGFGSPVAVRRLEERRVRACENPLCAREVAQSGVDPVGTPR